jgi:hypothetical protein
LCAGLHVAQGLLDTQRVRWVQAFFVVEGTRVNRTLQLADLQVCMLHYPVSPETGPGGALGTVFCWAGSAGLCSWVSSAAPRAQIEEKPCHHGARTDHLAGRGWSVGAGLGCPLIRCSFRVVLAGFSFARCLG